MTNATDCRRYRVNHPSRVKARNENTRQKPGFKEYDNAAHKRRRRTKIGWCKATVWGSRKRAKDRGIEHTITYRDVLAVWPRRGMCPVLGVRLKVGSRTFGNRSPSLDRINNHIGYVPGNICVISNRANIIKNDSTVDELKKVIRYMEARQ